MNNRYYVFILILFFVFACNIVYAGDNSTHYSPDVVNQSNVGISDEVVSALEDGHFNISFSDGSNGYCLEYGEQEASMGDKFYKVDTDYARNNLNNERVGNYLKLYFTQYTSHAMSDKVRTQHMIWHFTDDFDGWRLNYTIINEIKSSNQRIPDFYTVKLNDTHERVWVFSVLLSPFEHHQNYFNYQTFIHEIQNTSDDFNGSMNNSGVNSTNNSLINNSLINKTLVNQSSNIYQIYTNNKFSSVDEFNHRESNLKPHLTGMNLFNTIFILLFGLVLLILIWVIQKIIIK